MPAAQDRSGGPAVGVGRATAIRQIVWLLGSIIVCFAAAGIGGAITSTSLGEWYQNLAKPDWTPPAWIFGPVWTALYLSMAVAAWLVWQRGGWPAARAPLAWFAVQLALNVAWSAVFFGLRSPGLAVFEIAFLWLVIAATVVLFWRQSRVAAWLLIPYLAWTSFAAVLNFTVWKLNA
jgi:translocator protein